jgi:hypothetical protein
MAVVETAGHLGRRRRLRDGFGLATTGFGLVYCAGGSWSTVFDLRLIGRLIICWRLFLDPRATASGLSSHLFFAHATALTPLCGLGFSSCFSLASCLFFFDTTLFASCTTNPLLFTAALFFFLASFLLTGFARSLLLLAFRAPFLYIGVPSVGDLSRHAPCFARGSSCFCVFGLGIGTPNCRRGVSRESFAVGVWLDGSLAPVLAPCVSRVFTLGVVAAAIGA